MTGFTFEVLCNPFEGYKFDQEFQYASERYLLRVLVQGKTSQLVFYSLPSDYSNLELSKYKFKTIEELNRSREANIKEGEQIQCIKSKFIHQINIAVTGITPINFWEKGEEYSKEAKTNPEVAAFQDVTSHLSKIPLQFAKTSLQVVLKG